MLGLLSYFEPFDGYSSNSSERIVSEVCRIGVEGLQLSATGLPVEFNRAWPALQSSIESTNPDFVLAFGQAGGINSIHLERVAINLMDARIPDNSGFQPDEEEIHKNGAPAHFTPLPLKAILRDLRQDQPLLQISNSAGTYVCNALMYQLLEYSMLRGLPAGFIHVPLLPDQEREGRMPEKCCSLGEAASVICRIIKHISDWKVDQDKLINEP